MFERFREYVAQYNLKNKKIKLKYRHSLLVSKLCNEIGKSLGLDAEKLELATLIGLLHDIGRFEQHQKYKTFVDSKSEDHGQLGARILFENDLIRDFIKDPKYDEIIRLTLIYHNDYMLPEGLDPETKIFCQIVRDADKLDILRQKARSKIKFNERRKVTEIVYKKFMAEQSILLGDIENQSRYDAVVLWVALIYDLNFDYSFQYLKKRNYINKLLDKLLEKLDKETVDELRTQANRYIDGKVNKKRR